jgi:hypothetical protein
VASASEEEGPGLYPGFEDDARTWGLQTSAGIGAGVVMGWIKGASDTAHLAGTYGRGSVYHGTFAEFRVPSNYVQVRSLRLVEGTLQMQATEICATPVTLLKKIFERPGAPFSPRYWNAGSNTVGIMGLASRRFHRFFLR